MEPELAVNLISDSVWIMIKFVCVLIVPSLLVGLVIAVFQGATQINEQTLSFLPRLLVSFMMIVFAGHWMMSQMVKFFDYLFTNIPLMIG